LNLLEGISVIHGATGLPDDSQDSNTGWRLLFPTGLCIDASGQRGPPFDGAVA
jgi:hypothetical protein